MFCDCFEFVHVGCANDCADVSWADCVPVDYFVCDAQVEGFCGADAGVCLVDFDGYASKGGAVSKVFAQDIHGTVKVCLRDGLKVLQFRSAFVARSAQDVCRSCLQERFDAVGSHVG